MKGFLWVNTVLVIPGYARRVVLFYVCNQRFERGVEGVDPINMSAVPFEN